MKLAWRTHAHAHAHVVEIVKYIYFGFTRSLQYGPRERWKFSATEVAAKSEPRNNENELRATFRREKTGGGFFGIDDENKFFELCVKETFFPVSFESVSKGSHLMVFLWLESRDTKKLHNDFSFLFYSFSFPSFRFLLFLLIASKYSRMQALLETHFFVREVLLMWFFVKCHACQFSSYIWNQKVHLYT